VEVRVKEKQKYKAKFKVYPLRFQAAAQEISAKALLKLAVIEPDRSSEMHLFLR